MDKELKEYLEREYEDIPNEVVFYEEQVKMSKTEFRKAMLSLQKKSLVNKN